MERIYRNGAEEKAKSRRADNLTEAEFADLSLGDGGGFSAVFLKSVRKNRHLKIYTVLVQLLDFFGSGHNHFGNQCFNPMNR